LLKWTYRLRPGRTRRELGEMHRQVALLRHAAWVDVAQVGQGTGPEGDEKVWAMRADRETALAIGAADYVLANLAAEIDAFTAVAEEMRRRLSELDPGQRAEVEEASRILRRARAARTLPLTDITSRATDTA